MDEYICHISIAAEDPSKQVCSEGIGWVHHILSAFLFVFVEEDDIYQDKIYAFGYAWVFVLI